MMKNIKTILIFAIINLLRFFRDKVALFFTFLFPLVYLLVFGFMFGNKKAISLKVAIINNSDSIFSEEFIEKAYEDNLTFKYDTTVKTIEEAQVKLKEDKISVIFELPKNFGALNENNMPSGEIMAYYSKNKEQEGSVATTLMQAVLDSINKMMGVKNPPLTVNTTIFQEEGTSSFDYVFSGLIGFTLLGNTLFRIAFQLPAEKRTGALRRLRASSLKKSHLILSNAAVALVVTLLTLVLVTLVSLVVFHLNMRGSWIFSFFYAVICILMLTGLGLFVGGWAKNENQAAPLVNLISFPMMILSGTFFPRFLMPEWLQSITDYVPLTPVVDGFRKIITENAGIIDVLPQLCVIGVWTILIYTLVIKSFRWE